MDSLLLLLVLRNLLRPDYTVELIDFISMLWLFIIQMLVESCDRVLHVQRKMTTGAASCSIRTHPSHPSRIHLILHGLTGSVTIILRSHRWLVVIGGSDALLRHEVLVEISCSSSSGSHTLRANRCSALLLSDRPLIQIARLE